MFGEDVELWSFSVCNFPHSSLHNIISVPHINHKNAVNCSHPYLSSPPPAQMTGRMRTNTQLLYLLVCVYLNAISPALWAVTTPSSLPTKLNVYNDFAIRKNQMVWLHEGVRNCHEMATSTQTYFTVYWSHFPLCFPYSIVCIFVIVLGSNILELSVSVWRYYLDW